MIQRIQSVYLALTFLLDVTIFFTPLYSRISEDPSTWIPVSFQAVLVLAGLVSVISIFMYSNRSNQVRWVKGAMVFQIMAVGFAVGILLSLGGIGSYLWDEALSTGVLILGLLLQIGALRGIREDQQLVRSMDRIR